MSNQIRITPFRDEEAADAVQFVLGSERFLKGMRQFLPKELFDALLKAKDNVHSIFDFQSKLIYPIMLAVQQKSISRRTAEGLAHINAEDKYLYISNHRDIILDSAFLNTFFYEHKVDTCQAAIGSNLMKDPVADAFFRLNKSFVVTREGTPRELYQSSLELSQYIFDQITSKTVSIWIAQREGRAKDGNDRTQTSLLKMLGMSNKGDFAEHCRALKIVPVAVSYEFDPCDLLKTQEYIEKQLNPTYQKTFQQDLENMLSGVYGDKGQLNFHLSKPLDEELEVLKETRNKKEQLEILAKLIDEKIHTTYLLHPINYVAYDMLNAGKKYADKYSSADFEKYQAIFDKKIKSLGEHAEMGRSYLLNMYANPVVNAASY